ncbi:uncharacterized protein LOC132549911 [Ylistrum balloti]|uniref:uncharacterized protein LOC132549911 n=1 Tax=Ylistrum balloti TaxID=509963 RepID=UPI002905C8F1|nr:uncharacterized protein LOC132549911 [Ylistrum balloti]
MNKMATISDVFLRYGDDAYTLNDFNIAASFYSYAAMQTVVSDYSEILKKRSKCYYKTEKYARAFDDIVEILKIWPSWVEGYIYAGSCLTYLKDFKNAMLMYSRGLKLDPGNEIIQKGLLNVKTKLSENGGTTYDPLTLCTQDAYPGDDELVKMEQLRLDKIGSVDIPEFLNVPDTLKLRGLIQSVCKHKEDGEFNLAESCLMAAIREDADNYSLYHILAEILYQNGNFEKAFQFCEMIPKQQRSYDTWILGSQIRQVLKVPVSTELWLKNATKFGGKRAEEAAMLFQDVRVQRLYDPLSSGTKVNIRFTKFGRTMHATDEVNKGGYLFREKPLIIAQAIDSLDIPACGHCGKSLITAEQYFGQGVIRQNNQIRAAVEKYWPKIDRLSCEKCDTEIYCSTSCRTEAWDDYHQILCSSRNKNVEKLHQVCQQFKKLREENCRVWDGVWNAAFSPITLAQLWARIICDAKRIANTRGATTPDRQDIAKAKAKFRRFIAYGSAKNAKVVPRMLAIMREIFSDLADGVTLEITDKEFEGRYFQIACNIQEFADPEPPYRSFITNVKAKPQVWACVSPHIRSEPPEATFTGLFMLHACMNHSCDNNAEVRDRFVDGRPGIALQAKKPINLGQEVTISYIDTRMCRQDRQTWLYQSYNFWCTCTKCQYEGDDATSCTNCKKQAPNDKLFPACSRCHRAWYCSSHCQKVAWKKGHKSICNK